MRSWRYLWIFALALGFAVMAVNVPAQAQFFGTWGYPVAQPPELMPQTVAEQLKRAGYKVRRIERDHKMFIVDGADKAGRQVRLVVHPASGEILQRYAMVNPRGGASDASGAARAPAAVQPDGASPAHKPRPQGSRAKPAPSQATITPAAPTAPEQARPEAPAPVAAAAPAPAPVPAPAAAPQPAPQPTPPAGYANGVPINPLD